MLENFLNSVPFLQKIFKKKSKSFLGVDIGASAIKVVQLKKEKGVAVLETYGELSLGPLAGVATGQATNLSEKQISGALVDLIEEARVSVSSCGASIPLSSSLVFNMETPRVPQKQLEKIVPIEARRYIPVSISEVMLDWRIIPERQEDGENGVAEDQKISLETKDGEQNIIAKKLKIFVIAIHKNAIEQYQNMIKNAQLSLNFLEIEIFSTIRAVVEHNIGTVAILDIGSAVSKLYIVEYGVVKDSHVINRGSQDISLAISHTIGIAVGEAEKKKREIGLAGETAEDKKVSEIISSHLTYILLETNKVLRQYQTKNNKNIDELIFTGGGVVVKGLPALTSSILEINSRIADPFSKTRTPAFLDNVLKEIGPEFAVAVGLALRGLEEG